MESVEQQIVEKKPLLICDVDEVVLEFVKPFEVFLKNQNLILRKTSLQLGGNIIDLRTRSPLSKTAAAQLTLDFHEKHVDEQPFTSDAIRVLKALGQEFQIVFLTNIPRHLTQRRQDHLWQNGLRFPVLSNSGSKGHAVGKLHDLAGSTTIFIDDLPYHHQSVKSQAPRVECIHFMADPTFRNLVELPPDVAHRTSTFSEIAALCQTIVNGSKSLNA